MLLDEVVTCRSDVTADTKEASWNARALRVHLWAFPGQPELNSGSGTWNRGGEPHSGAARGLASRVQLCSEDGEDL